MFENKVFEHQDRDVAAIAQPQVRVGIDIDLVEIDVQGAELGRHLVAEVAALAAVQLSLCQ